MNNKERLIKGLKMIALFAYILCMIASSMNTINTMKAGAIFGIVSFFGGGFFLVKFFLDKKKIEEQAEAIEKLEKKKEER